MELKVIAGQASFKGLQLVGTGDALQEKWLQEIEALEDYSEGIYALGETKFIVTVELEDRRKVHHLILLPGVSSALSLREEISSHASSLKDGRPRVNLGGEEIVDLVEEAGGLCGPSHAFVPWTSVYKEYDSLEDCYGSASNKVNFLELGLSADSYMADRVKELQELTFLSNSDAHSPWPNKLGREFNRLELEDLSFGSLAGAMERGGKSRVTLNVGFDPRLGKYHRSACISCHTHYSLNQAMRIKWRCMNCRGRIKKGVLDRIGEIAEWEEPHHPPHRPSYIKIAPLSEIIAAALGTNSYSKKVQSLWNGLVEEFGSEIAVLIDGHGEEIGGIAGEEIARRILSFRKGDFGIREGGGGKYGEVFFDAQSSAYPQNPQKSLDIY